MDIEWIYAKFSHIMKQYGGPEKFVKYIVDDTNKKCDKKWLRRIVPSCFLLFPLAFKGAASIIQDIKKNRKSKDYIVLEETILDDEQDT